MSDKLGSLALIMSLLPLQLFGEEPVDSHHHLKRVATKLQEALNQRPQPEMATEADRLQGVGADCVEQLGGDHLGTEMLRSAIEKSRTAKPDELKAAVRDLRSAMQGVNEMLAFKPIIEADAPEGFPSWTPIGKVELKQYPGYRMARFDMARGARENSAFFTLFRHIKENKIEMTAPVEMQYDAGEEKLRQMNMAFLYGSKDLGPLGKTQTGVQVTDVPKTLVLSIGMRGRDSNEQIRTAQSALRSWLDRNKEMYESAGHLRVLGYNSPFVFGNRRYFEVQIPVDEKIRNNKQN